MEDEVGSRFAEVFEDGLEGGEVAVDVGDDGGAHSLTGVERNPRG